MKDKGQMYGEGIRLQLALDVPSEDLAVNTARRVKNYFDWVEAGTPLILKTGLGVIQKLRSELPEHTLVADVKIMDAGKMIATMAFDAGADVVTVMAAAPTPVLREVVDVAGSKGKHVMLDLLGVELTKQLIEKIIQNEVHIVTIHRPHAFSDETFDGLETMTETLQKNRIQFAIAGRLTPQIIPTILKFKPCLVIIGSAITKAEDPISVATQIRRFLP